MGPALDEFKAGAFLQSQNRNRKAQKQACEEAPPGARALVSLPEGRRVVGKRRARNIPVPRMSPCPAATAPDISPCEWGAGAEPCPASSLLEEAKHLVPATGRQGRGGHVV